MKGSHLNFACSDAAPTMIASCSESDMAGLFSTGGVIRGFSLKGKINKTICIFHLFWGKKTTNNHLCERTIEFESESSTFTTQSASLKDFTSLRTRDHSSWNKEEELTSAGETVTTTSASTASIAASATQATPTALTVTL